MPHLLTNAEFAQADCELNRLLGLSAAAAGDTIEQVRLAALIAVQLANILVSAPVSRRSAAVVIRAIANPDAVTIDPDIRNALLRVEGFLSAPGTDP